MPRGVYKRTEAHRAIFMRAVAASAKKPRSDAQKAQLHNAGLKAHRMQTYLVASEAAAHVRHQRQDAFVMADSERKRQLEEARLVVLLTESELASIVKEQMKDERTNEWGDRRNLSLDAQYSIDGSSLYDRIGEVTDYQQYLDERLTRLIGY